MPAGAATSGQQPRGAGRHPECRAYLHRQIIGHPATLHIGPRGCQSKYRPLLDDFVLATTGKERPKVCFVPTASGDSAGYVDRFYAAFSSRDCLPTHLSLFRREHRDLRALILSQDVVYVGGGNTANLIAVWRLHGLDEVLREAYEAGVLLCGISAGAACWFDACPAPLSTGSPPPPTAPPWRAPCRCGASVSGPCRRAGRTAGPRRRHRSPARRRSRPPPPP
ncbi:Type 1 glutamine amidotransferase-like domain-containing protein [Microbispora hainanensis]|uniref:Type 1 glutamine amidotransferase-like domain-containing protein n=1 Tax=Microbispora hainanensis TaxID=568844 RepID=UPI0033F45840